MMHWAAQYVGLPHVLGGRGPNAFDCWGLLLHIYKQRFDIALPSLPGITAESAMQIHHEMKVAMAGAWDKVDEPFDGCAVAMSQAKAYHHVGVYLDADGGKVMHCWDEAKVIVDTLPRLRLKGMKRIDYFKHRLWHTS